MKHGLKIYRNERKDINIVKFTAFFYYFCTSKHKSIIYGKQ